MFFGDSIKYDSPACAELLHNWEDALSKFPKVVPHPETAPAPAPQKEKKERPARAAKPHAEDFKVNEPVPVSEPSGMHAEMK